MIPKPALPENDTPKKRKSMADNDNEDVWVTMCKTGLCFNIPVYYIQFGKALCSFPYNKDSAFYDCL